MQNVAKKARRPGSYLVRRTERSGASVPAICSSFFPGNVLFTVNTLIDKLQNFKYCGTASFFFSEKTFQLQFRKVFIKAAFFFYLLLCHPLCLLFCPAKGLYSIGFLSYFENMIKTPKIRKKNDKTKYDKLSVK